MRAINIFFSFFCICFNFWRIRSNSSILHSSEFNFHKVIVFIFLQSQLLTFRFDSSNTNFTTAWKARFIFFRASTCNFITTENKKDDDDENVFRDFFDKKISMIAFERSSTMILCIDSMSFSAMRNFNASRKISFVYFSMISDANNRDKLRKRATNRANREKNVEVCRDKFEKSRANRAKREKDVNVLKAFINDFLSNAVTFLKSSNEIDLMLKLKT